MRSFLILGVTLLFGVVGCGGEPASPPGGEPDASPDAAPERDITVEGGTNCGFDEESAGRNLGDEIENFGLKTYQGEDYWLHGNCDTGKKVVWVVLATGWCGACENYAPRLEEIWQQYKDQGLEVMWVLGETEDFEPVDFEWAEAFVQDKGVTYTVLRDYNFYQVYGAIEPYSSSLPHQYLLDADNMELIFAQGGTSDEIETFVFQRLAE